MQFIDSILYRRLTKADFANIENVKKPSSGGGQSYIDLSALPMDDVRDFFEDSVATEITALSKTDNAGQYWPGFRVPARPIGMDNRHSFDVEVRSASKGVYRNYKISNQWLSQNRHAAWRPENGFPTVIGSHFDVGSNHPSSAINSYISTLFDVLTIVIIKTKRGRFHTGFFVGTDFPSNWPTDKGLESIFTGKKTSGLVVPNRLLALDPSLGFTDCIIDTSVEAYDLDSFFSDVFMTEDDYFDIVALLLRKKNVIFKGSPGTGKTFASKRIAYSLMGAKDDSCICFVQFHQNSTYEDYIIGYRPNSSGVFELQEGAFFKFFSKAANKPDEDFFLIIDEINRANISKVFGEMLLAIEADHRDELLNLPSAESSLFVVPSNVYIIGMMNTADRGLSLIDYALRRRFAFVDMVPAFETDSFGQLVSEMGSSSLLALVDSIKKINSTICSDPSLGPGFAIGHSYFCLSEAPTDDVVHSIVKYEIAPLIAEYWFDQPELASSSLRSIYEAIGPIDD